MCSVFCLLVHLQYLTVFVEERVDDKIARKSEPHEQPQKTYSPSTAIACIPFLRFFLPKRPKKIFIHH